MMPPGLVTRFASSKAFFLSSNPNKWYIGPKRSVTSKVLEANFFKFRAFPCMAFTVLFFCFNIPRLYFTSSTAVTSYPSSASATLYRPVPAPISRILISCGVRREEEEACIWLLVASWIYFIEVRNSTCPWREFNLFSSLNLL